MATIWTGNGGQTAGESENWTNGVEHIESAGELITLAGAAPSRVYAARGTWVNHGAPVHAIIDGASCEWHRTTENASDIFVSGGTLIGSPGSHIGRLTIGPLAQYFEGQGVTYGPAGVSYIEHAEPILIEV